MNNPIYKYINPKLTYDDFFVYLILIIAGLSSLCNYLDSILFYLNITLTDVQIRYIDDLILGLNNLLLIIIPIYIFYLIYMISNDHNVIYTTRTAMLSNNIYKTILILYSVYSIRKSRVVIL